MTKLTQVIDTLHEHIIPLSATDATDVIKLHNHRLCTNTSIFLQIDLHIFFHPLCMNPPAVHKGIYFHTHYITLALQCIALHNVITIDSLNLPPFSLSELILQRKITNVHFLDPFISLKAEVLPLLTSVLKTTIFSLLFLPVSLHTTTNRGINSHTVPQPDACMYENTKGSISVCKSSTPIHVV